MFHVEHNLITGAGDLVTRPCVRYFGGKWRIAPWLIRNMPKHDVYCEPYGGAGSILLRKDRTPAEIYNDLDGRIVNVFRCLQDPAKAMRIKHRLTLTPFSRAEYERCYEPVTDDVDDACKTIVISFFGFGSDSMNRRGHTGFRGRMSDKRATPAQAWATYADSVDSYTNRLRGVVLEQCDALDLIRRYDTERTLFLVDPPYVHSTRDPDGKKPRHGYRHEMDDAAHRALAAKLHAAQGMVILCGYPSPPLRGALRRLEPDRTRRARRWCETPHRGGLVQPPRLGEAPTRTVAMNPNVCPTCGQNWPDRQGRVCSACGLPIGKHHKYRFVGSTVQHRDCKDPTLAGVAAALQAEQAELLPEPATADVAPALAAL